MPQLQRTFVSELAKWKNSKNRKPLILEGARQIGKTWVLKEFGRLEYKNVAYINCDHNPAVEHLFDDYDTKRILRQISAITEQPIEEENTLVIIDEIQELPGAIASLKYFCENESGYHIAVAGSLLGIKMHRDNSFPVGKVKTLKMHPMDFEEFLLALGRNELVSFLRESTFEEISKMSGELVDLLRQYYFVGGMPEAVLTYVETGDLKAVRDVQNEILLNYQDDISKHAEEKLVPKINLIWNSIPAQLVKENKKFIYGAIKSGARAADYETAIQWLIDAGIVHKVPRITKAGVPLKFYEDFSAFKLFFNDSGLFAALAQTPAKEILVGSSIFSEYKGAFTEQFVFQQLTAGDKSFIYYYSNENSTMEVDFVVQKDDEVFPIEVKAEENLRSKSLKAFVEKFASERQFHAVRFSMSDYKNQDWMENIPLYCVFEWGKR